MVKMRRRLTEMVLGFGLVRAKKGLSGEDEPSLEYATLKTPSKDFE